METFILNFGHALSHRCLAHLQPCKEIRVGLQIDMNQPTIPQVVEVIKQVEKVIEQKGGALDGSVPLIVNIPGLAEYTAVILAELAGRLGEFPRILSLRREAASGTWNCFADSANLGVLDLERVRQESRGRRKIHVPAENS